MNLILFGFKGSGKTHFGKLLAQKLHRTFIDTDDLIVKLYGKHLGPREIYNQIGEEQYRTLENEAIFSLKEIKNAIIALGGGAILDTENIKLLQKIGALAYLKTSSQKLQKRLQQDPPAFFDPADPELSFLEHYQERLPIYESIVAAHIDCDILDEAGVLSALQSLLILQDPPNGF